MEYNEAQLRKQKWNVASKAVKSAMNQCRGALQACDSEACGDCTAALARLTPGQGMLPDGSPGAPSCPLSAPQLRE